MAKNEERTDLPEDEVKTDEAEEAVEVKTDEPEEVEVKADEVAEDAEEKSEMPGKKPDMDEDEGELPEDEEKKSEMPDDEEDEEKPEDEAEEKSDDSDVETADDEAPEAKTVIPIEIEEEKSAPEDTDEKGMMLAPDVEEEKPYVEDEEEDEKGGMTDPRIARRAALLQELAALNRAISSGQPAEDDEAAMQRKRRDEFLARMGMKSEDVAELGDDEVIYCASEGKALASSEPCSFCRGGCVKEGELPSLLEVAMQAELDLKGEVLGLGYEPNKDKFILDVKRHSDGAVVETVYSGEGKSEGWYLLDQDLVAAVELEGKDALGSRKIVDANQAEEIALKSFDGTALSITPAIFEGYDSYAVEVDTTDGKSLDVYVGLDGGVIGFDTWGDNPTEEEVKALEEELGIKEELSEEAPVEEKSDEVVEAKRDDSMTASLMELQMLAEEIDNDLG